MESLLHLSETEMTRLFSTAPTFEFLLDAEMSVVDLVKKVRPKFRDGKQCMPVIQKIIVDCNDHKILDRSVMKTGNPEDRFSQDSSYHEPRWTGDMLCHISFLCERASRMPFEMHNEKTCLSGLYSHRRSLEA